MDEAVAALQSKTDKIYSDILSPLGLAYQVEINTPRHSDAGKPTVLFLGNHSSGKSTFINFLLGQEVQKTGIAPTDDGFTILTYAEVTEESTGPAAALRPEVTFAGLDRFGPAFLSRLKLKFLNAELLKEMTLVDSPGMIDAATTAQERGYDFMSTVRIFGESADLVLFMMDPEKPGTTGETIAAFTQGLSGLENKTLILMNKADTFSNIRDFARDYGALCWNLSRVIHTKDMPEIYTTYIPLAHSAEGVKGSLPLDAFDEARDEVVHHIKHALQRRVDNVISTLSETALRLDMHVRVAWELKRSLLTAKSTSMVITFAIFALTAGLGVLTRRHEDTMVPLSIIGVGVLITILWWMLSRQYLRRRGKALVRDLDAAFERIFERDFTLGKRDDLQTRWSAIRGHLAQVLDTLGMDSIPGKAPKWNSRYRKLQKLIQRDIAALRPS